jgi:2-polyprenyl-3-methyl-5-hydroxy-6-metoxy-1,4-benzoquinol methylase
MNLLIEEHPVQTKEHWEKVYTTKAATHVSWFQEHAAMSLQLITRQSVPLSASIIDVGGGASTLVDDLLDAGYRKLTVLDLSGAAIATAKARLGERAVLVQWLEANVLEERLPPHRFDVWHDRAVFHFLTTEQEREAYVQQVLRAVKPAGSSLSRLSPKTDPRSAAACRSCAIAQMTCTHSLAHRLNCLVMKWSRT